MSRFLVMLAEIVVLTAAGFYDLARSPDVTPRHPSVVVERKIGDLVELSFNEKVIFMFKRRSGYDEARRTQEGLLFGLTPVTNAQYQLAVAGRAVPAPTVLAVPEDSLVAPKDWRLKLEWKHGKHPEGQANHAVIFVTIGNAKAYCRWLEGKVPYYRFRLVRTEEWAELTKNLTDAEKGTAGPTRSHFMPRPAQGRQALRNKEGFSFAPHAIELLTNPPVGIHYRPVDPAADGRGGHIQHATGTHIADVEGTFHQISIGPAWCPMATAFRVVAEAKAKK